MHLATADERWWVWLMSLADELFAIFCQLATRVFPTESPSPSLPHWVSLITAHFSETLRWTFLVEHPFCRCFLSNCNGSIVNCCFASASSWLFNELLTNPQWTLDEFSVNSQWTLGECQKQNSRVHMPPILSQSFFGKRIQFLVNHLHSFWISTVQQV